LELYGILIYLCAVYQFREFREIRKQYPLLWCFPPGGVICVLTTAKNGGKVQR